MTTNVVTDEQLGILARRQNDLFRRVREGTLPVDLVLKGIQDLIEGNFDPAPRPSGRVLDFDKRPYIPDNWRIKSEDQLPNRVTGRVEFDPENMALYLDPAQKDDVVMGDKLRPKLANLTQRVYGARALDSLLADTARIPESWKKVGYIFFWGTIYRDSVGLLCVRYLFWEGGRWGWYYRWLGREFDARNLAAVSAS